MNNYVRSGLVLGGGTMVFDRIIPGLPDPAAIVLYSAAVILMIAGMIADKKRSH